MDRWWGITFLVFIECIGCLILVAIYLMALAMNEVFGITVLLAWFKSCSWQDLAVYAAIVGVIIALIMIIFMDIVADYH